MTTDIQKIAVLGELIDFCDEVETHEQKANTYKKLKQNLICENK